MSTYISGPMSGYPDFNRGAFGDAEADIRWAKGEHWPIDNPATLNLGPSATWHDYMRRHIATISTRVSEMVVLPGWEVSRGARLEVDIAHALGIPVMPLDAYLAKERTP